MTPIDPEKIGNLLIRGTNWVGDAVMSVPALREIRRLFHRSRISLLVRPWVRDVYLGAKFVDEIIDYDKDGIHRGFGGRLRMLSRIRRGEFDLAILLQTAFEAAFLARMAGIPCRVGYARDARSFMLTHAVPIDPEVRNVHQGYYYLGILSGIGLLESRIWKTGIRLNAALPALDRDRESARSMLRGKGYRSGEMLVGVNPGAFFGGAKRWILDRYSAVADLLAEKYRARVVIFGGRAERPIALEVAAKMRHQPIVFAGETTLAQLMGLLKECSLLITNDSGPMHLAAALDVPQVAIFGSSSEIATGPLSEQATVIRQPVDCSPCFLRECPIDFRCMTGISVEKVFGAACVKLE